MTWLTTIIDFFKQLFGFGEKIAENKGQRIPMQEESIKSEAKKDAVKDEQRIDTLKDRDLRREPKDFLAFATEEEFLQALGSQAAIQTKALYVGDKGEILTQVKRDYANVLTRKMAKIFLEDISASDKKFFIIRIAPQTVH